VKEKGMKVGLAVKPDTHIDTLIPYLSTLGIYLSIYLLDQVLVYLTIYLSIYLLDQVLVMTVEPGFGGQKFMVDMMSKGTIYL
jgi:ribulose-phosphate 3-epimerase